LILCLHVDSFAASAIAAVCLLASELEDSGGEAWVRRRKRATVAENRFRDSDGNDGEAMGCGRRATCNSFQSAAFVAFEVCEKVRSSGRLSTLIEWSKNVRKRKISKVERGLRGRGAGRGLRLFYFSVGFVGKRRNSCLCVLGDLRGEIFWIDSAPRAGTPGIECGRSTGHGGQARGKRRIRVSKIRHGGQKRAGRMQIDAKSGPNRHSDVKQARVGQKLGQPQIIYRTAAAHDSTSDIEWAISYVC
jgi:hypothetical protein